MNNAKTNGENTENSSAHKNLFSFANKNKWKLEVSAADGIPTFPKDFIN